MRVLIAGGGTGGHVYPSLAIMDGLLRSEPNVKLAYVGTRRGLEARILPTYSAIRFFRIHVRGLERHRPLQNLCSLLLLALGLTETLLLLLHFRPHIIIGMGGYASFPALLLGSLVGKVLPVRTLIHEQNVAAGLTNRLLAPFVDKVLISYPQSQRYFRRARQVVVTGNPIRKEFHLVKRSEALYRKFGLVPQRRTVLVFGGSHGSVMLTNAVLRAKATIAKNKAIQVLLITGETGEEHAVRKELLQAGVMNVVVRSYVDRMDEAFALADLIVSRAGASSLAEITSCGKPALLIPWEDAANGHQRENARVLEEQEACVLIEEKDFMKLSLATLIREIVEDEERLLQIGKNSMRLGRRQATTSILGEITTLAREGQA